MPIFIIYSVMMLYETFVIILLVICCRWSSGNTLLLRFSVSLLGFSGLLAPFLGLIFFSTFIYASFTRIRILFLAFGTWVTGVCGCLLPRSLLVLLYRKLKISYWSYIQKDGILILYNDEFFRDLYKITEISHFHTMISTIYWAFFHK